MVSNRLLSLPGSAVAELGRLFAGADDVQRVDVHQQRRQRQVLDQRRPELLAAFCFGTRHVHMGVQSLEDRAEVFGGDGAGEDQNRKHFQQHDEVARRRVEAGEGRVGRRSFLTKQQWRATRRPC